MQTVKSLKVHVLDLGTIEYDAGFPLAGAGVSSRSEPNPESPRRHASIIGALIEHPTVGPILYDTGIAPNYEELWAPVLMELFAIARYESEHRIDAVLQAAGYGLEDIKAVVISHLHIDHAGGLEFFRGRDVPVYVHADELKHAFYAVATGEDIGPYVPHYLDFSFNWQVVHGDDIELFPGFNLLRLPGHTSNLLGLRLDLSNAGTFLFTNDQYHLRENFETSTPLGWLLRDHAAWWHSHRQVRNLVDRLNPTLIFGHDPGVLANLRREKFWD
jgi:glyoxylase-like metal-dependent hydrolase (beta-lactamase superfamily II)